MNARQRNRFFAVNAESNHRRMMPWETLQVPNLYILPMSDHQQVLTIIHTA
jgi:hypothetical protein